MLLIKLDNLLKNPLYGHAEAALNLNLNIGKMPSCTKVYLSSGGYTINDERFVINLCICNSSKCNKLFRNFPIYGIHDNKSFSAVSQRAMNKFKSFEGARPRTFSFVYGFEFEFQIFR